MAKRYIRINWQNAPSVATPRNAENLNIMDKGIDDLDLYKIDTDAIANNLVTTEAGLVLDARQGKVLDDKVNTINNNLAIQSGAWTPTVAGGGVGTIRGTAAYYRIGKIVHISGFLYITMTSVDATQLNIGGLPFTISSARIMIPIGYSTLPNFSNHIFLGNSNNKNLLAQPIGTNGVYAGNEMVIGTEYILMFSGEYVCV